VTFARDQDDVTRLGDFDGARNRLRAIRDFFKNGCRETFFDLRDDLSGSSLRGLSEVMNGVVGLLVDNLTHQRTLLTIAISAATEDDDQSSWRKLAQGF